MEPHSYVILQFLLSITMIFVVIFALQEDFVTCDGHRHESDDYFWFKTLNTLTIPTFGCSIIGYIYIYLKVSDSDSDNNDNKQFKKPIIRNKIYICSFISQSFISLLLLMGVMIEFIMINKNNYQCFHHGINVGISIICDTVIIFLLFINLIIHLFLWFINPSTSVFANNKNNQYSSNNDKIHGEQEGKLQESVCIKIVEKEGEKDNEYTHYIDDSGIVPFVTYLNVPKDDEQCTKSWTTDCEIMKKYCDNFIENGYDNITSIKAITEQNLTDIGIEQKDERNVILMKIKELKEL